MMETVAEEDKVLIFYQQRKKQSSQQVRWMRWRKVMEQTESANGMVISQRNPNLQMDTKQQYFLDNTSIQLSSSTPELLSIDPQFTQLEIISVIEVISTFSQFQLLEKSQLFVVLCSIRFHLTHCSLRLILPVCMSVLVN